MSERVTVKNFLKVLKHISYQRATVILTADLPMQ